jgi:FkbM family methyltransferase
MSHELKLIRDFFKETEGLIIFDVGACNFNESYSFKELLKAEVYAFEPDRDNIKAFAEMAISKGIKVFPIALSDEDSETIFYPSDNLNGIVWKYSGSLIKPVVKEGTSEGIYHHNLFYDLKGYKVTTKRFDTFCKENNISKIDYLHIDVQGAEMKVLSALGNYRPKLIFAETCEFDTYETGINLEDFDNFMKNLGYIIRNRFEYDTLYEFYGS